MADARSVFGRDHLESAVRHAFRAIESGTATSRTITLEALLFLAGERQIGDAIRRAGISHDTKEIGIVAFGDVSVEQVTTLFGWTRDDRVLDAKGKDLRRLGIRAVEERTVPQPQSPDLALERTALLDVER